MYNRHCRHFGELNRNVHNNKHLQNAWNKYGEESFEFNVLEYCDVELLNEREKYWINHFKSTDSKYGYNIRIDPFTNRGLKWSETQREKMYESINKEGSWYRNHSIPKKTIRKSWELTRCPCCGGALGEWIGDGYTKDWITKERCKCGQLLDWDN